MADHDAARTARTRLDALVDDALTAGQTGSALQLRVTAQDDVLYARDAGFTRHATSDDDPEPRAPIGPRTRFDLASLTKPLCTTALVMQLVHEGRLALDAPPPVPCPDGVTLRHLLGHASGLPAWKPYHLPYASFPDAPPLTARTEVLQAVAAEQPEAPPGARTVYSDLGFILLGWAIANAGGARLDALFAQRIAQPLGLETRLGFRPARAAAAAERGLFAATERSAWRGRLLAGEVHDDTAFVMGGVAGHAGLFGDADAVDALARACARPARPARPSRPEGARSMTTSFARPDPEPVTNAHFARPDPETRQSPLFDPDTVRAFWRPTTYPPPPFALGWDMPSPSGWSGAGTLFPRSAVGHLGFTGTSLWLDPATGFAVTLLTNRVHPTRAAEAGLRALRPAIHDAAFALARASGLY